MKELIAIQSRLHAPKSQYNKFGKYKYRKAEDILEAVKPLLAEQGCTLVISDEIVLVGDRFYVKATATVKNGSGDKEFSVGYAREELSKKGMDDCQVTGASSSYARKYALNGLFAIDDNQDSDSTNVAEQQQQQQQSADTASQSASASQQYHPDSLQEALGMIARSTNRENLAWVINTYKPLMSNAEFMQTLSARRKELGI